MVAALRRQNQLRKLEDTWPMDGFCTYKYQLATQIEGQTVLRSHPKISDRTFHLSRVKYAGEILHATLRRYSAIR